MASIIRQALESGQLRDRILDNYGYYSINGPPNNETTHAHGSLTYIDESHDITMCAYPSSEYFFLFKGSVQAVVSEYKAGDGPGKAVQVDPITLTMNAPGTERLKLEYDNLLSSFAFKTNLRCYTQGPWAGGTLIWCGRVPRQGMSVRKTSGCVAEAAQIRARRTSTPGRSLMTARASLVRELNSR